MKGLLESFGIALCGLATSILVALANVVVARMTGFDFFVSVRPSHLPSPAKPRHGVHLNLSGHQF
ncbi:hypothetical protein ALP95_200003 [Pseudomonas savastanoi pv. glycinea]|nr:hypothetical protein ALP95_200003 [Pseudomonas savastanoi pv. glycinea]